MTIDHNRACGDHGPFTLTKTHKGRKTSVVALQCNRPCGHDGDHIWSDGYTGPRYQWDDADKAVTHQTSRKVRV